MSAAGAVFLTDIAVLAIAALALGLVFARFRLPVTGAEILAGVIVGPYVLNFVSDTAIITEISQLGIVLLLFIIGLELDPLEFRKILARVGGAVAVEVSITIILIFLGTFYLTNSFAASLVVAVGLSFTSTAIIGRLLIDQFGNDSKDYQKFLVSLLVIEDIVAVFFLVLIPEISGVQAVDSEGLSLLETGIGGVALVLISYFFGKYAAPRVINYFASFELESRDIPFLFSLSLGIIFGALANYLGYSPAIGSFMIGLALRGKYSKFVLQRVKGIRDLFLILFFVSIGTLIDPLSAFSLPVVLVGIILIGVFSKLAGAYIAGSLFATGLGRSSFAMWLFPRGEFSLIIAQSAMIAGIISVDIFSIVGLLVILTALLGPFYLVRKSNYRGKSEFPARPKSD